MRSRKRFWRILGVSGVSLSTLVLVVAALFALEVLSRDHVSAVASTTHAAIARRECIDCHAAIAEEWRQSFHYRSLTGPYWKDVREQGYMRVFDRTRKACVNCHAPANVLDLAVSAAATGAAQASLGVECTPNLLREPRGVVPDARSDDVDLGVDCTSCHVGKQGIVGPGRTQPTAHEVTPDPRFQDPKLASKTLCRTCHSATVRAWETTVFAADGVTCLDCHMPFTTAASSGGPPRLRRSHRFLGDKDASALEQAVNATLAVTGDGRARFRITNDRVGHYFPSGGNWLSVRIAARDNAGGTVAERFVVFGKDEPLLLDIWPFNRDRRLACGETREVLFQLPEGHGTVEATVRYHDWMRTKATILALEKEY